MAETQAKPQGLKDCPVAGVGASAGGIEALRVLFAALPPAPGLAIVVVQHLAPDLPSHLRDVLARWTSLPVREAADGMALERDCVYVAPPDRALGLRDGAFATCGFDPKGTRPGVDTIDFFFASLAADRGAGAIAVVLSGASADGAAGAARIGQAGGRVLVQDPASALYGDMPWAAIDSGFANQILPLAALAEELVGG
jgi:two-component system CheB/CheR fusion protein